MLGGYLNNFIKNQKGILVIRFVVFIPYGVIICLLYFYEA